MGRQQFNEVGPGLRYSMVAGGIILPVLLILGIVWLWPVDEKQDEFQIIIGQIRQQKQLSEALADDGKGGDSNREPESGDSAGGNAASADRESGDGSVEQNLPPWPAPEVRLILIVVLTGALGSYIHIASSFADFVGNRRLARSWVPWYCLRPCTGAVLALLFYFCMRGGVLNPEADFERINLFGILAIAGLAGLFSKQALDKLEEVFTTMFKTKTNIDAQRRDKLYSRVPQIAGLLPASISAGAADTELTVIGTDFDPGCVVRFGDDNYEPLSREGIHELKLLVKTESFTRPRSVKVCVVNPQDKGGWGDVVEFRIFAKPTIRSLKPDEMQAGAQRTRSLTITGENFVDDSLVDFAGKTVVPIKCSRSKLVIELLPEDLASARKAAVKVMNGRDRGGDSDAVKLNVQRT